MWTEEPGGLLSIGPHRVEHDWSDLACMHLLEKKMATHSSILAWRIPGTEKPGGLPPMGSQSWTGLKRLSSSSSSSRFLVAVWNLPYLGTWSSAYLRLLIFLPAILIPACASSSPASLMMYSAYKLNNQGDNIQPWCTAFPIWNQSVVPVLTVACWPAYRFLKAGQVVCYSHLFQSFP